MIYGSIEGGTNNSVHVSDRDEGGVCLEILVERLGSEWHGGDGLLDLTAIKDEDAGTFVARYFRAAGGHKEGDDSDGNQKGKSRDRCDVDQ